MEYPPCVEINPEGDPRHSVIWLHGLGADGNDFVPLLPELRIPADRRVRFVFPNAPMLPVTVNNGYVMPAWYDIYAMDLMAKIDVKGILRSADYLLTLIDQEVERGVASGNILLAGFSQGGVIALAAALRTDKPLAGVMALSTYLPRAVPVDGSVRRRIFQAHGRMDDVVPWQAAMNARRRLEEMGHDLSWHEYDMAHSLCAEEVADMREWMLEVLG
ncbi:alpha/beta hydrolase [Thiolapillus brandeum]|uniref:Phospholipase/carboxylesterase family protein n=1 Tax=Thiolapillus brandeum TaxID=1076588 RepID=A0A7U6GGP5_9GAMM|nr:alpha/beta fold hydrolase [Thiolapillus brandeum]BAO43309.1 phospholipase/carboxylesterase family protein [Thiolapillus brandeum]